MGQNRSKATPLLDLQRPSAAQLQTLADTRTRWLYDGETSRTYIMEGQTFYAFTLESRVEARMGRIRQWVRDRDPHATVLFETQVDMPAYK